MAAVGQMPEFCLAGRFVLAPQRLMLPHLVRENASLDHLDNCNQMTLELEAFNTEIMLFALMFSRFYVIKVCFNFWSSFDL